MKNAQETRQLFDQVIQHPETSWALATIVGIEGSSYRRPGAKLLVAEDGRVFGQVSGGCLEETVKEHALQSIASGRPELLRLDTTDQEGTLWGFGMGCQGVLHVLIDPLGRDCGWTECLFHALREGLPVTWKRMVDLKKGRVTSIVEVGAEEEGLTWSPEQHRHSIVERFVTPTTLVVFGAGDDAAPLVRLAADCAFRVVVVDHRPAYCTPERFPQAQQCLIAQPDDELGVLLNGSCCVIQTHHFARDKDWLGIVLADTPAYVGLLGPRSRCGEVIQGCANPKGLTVHGPIGLALGAEGSEQIAVSILSEVLAVLNQQVPAHLSDGEGRIHDV